MKKQSYYFSRNNSDVEELTFESLQHSLDKKHFLKFAIYMHMHVFIIFSQGTFSAPIRDVQKISRNATKLWVDFVSVCFPCKISRSIINWVEWLWNPSDSDPLLYVFVDLKVHNVQKNSNINCSTVVFIIDVCRFSSPVSSNNYGRSNRQLISLVHHLKQTFVGRSISLVRK